MKKIVALLSFNVLMSATFCVHADALESRSDSASQKQCSFLPCSIMEESNRYLREGGANGGNAQEPGQEKAPQLTLSKKMTIRDYPIPCDPSAAAMEEYDRTGRCDLSYSENAESFGGELITVNEAIERCQRPRILIDADGKKTYVQGDSLAECKQMFASPAKPHARNRRARSRSK
jgi:hypothetical protein